MRNTILCLLFLFGVYSASAQVITVVNPSFEGPAQSSSSPPNWSACGGSPDTQPPWWGVSLPASNGSTYYGLVYLQSLPSSQESGSALLSSPLVVGTQYSLTVDLVNLQIYNGSWNGNCIVRLWGSSGCGLSQVLWSSPQLTNSTWNNHSISFTPTVAHTHLAWQIVIATGTFSSAGVDNMSSLSFVVLDVEIENLVAVPNSDHVALTWEARGEDADTRFYVERSSEGINFESLGMVSGQASKKDALQHEFQDYKPLFGLSYYRLRTVDCNGRESVSPAVEIKYFDPNGLALGQIVPNPSQGQVAISVLSDRDRLVSMTFYDALGRQVLELPVALQAGQNKLETDLSGLEAGVYFLKIGGSPMSRRVVVE